ncbi:MAG: SGNH/GDSL hydrolase family protein [bacterium]|nr:SGNH/GDSL hydrolase family protein [bacterium]
MKQLLIKLSLMSVATMLCLVMAEPIVRLIVDPVNYLLPEMIDDDRLRRRIQGGSGGHDDWGFRNPEVPESVEIVAVGDSQTYGNSAAAHNSWPAWLARETDRSVYNFGIGGWGPYEYLEILRTKGVELSPEVVVIGLYLGNDLYNASRSLYEMDYWKDRRDPARSEELRTLRAEFVADKDAAEKAGVKKAGGLNNLIGSSIRQWLRRNSVLYRMTVVSVGHWFRPFEVALVGESGTEVTVVDDPNGTLLTVLDPTSRFAALDLDNPLIAEGLNLTLEVLPELRDVSRDHGAEIVVIIIPTKIRVFAEYTQMRGLDDQRELIDKLARNEQIVLAMIESLLQEEEIPYASAYEELKELIGGETIYPRNSDGHPRSAGYHVIAKEAARMIETLGDSHHLTHR